LRAAPRTTSTLCWRHSRRCSRPRTREEEECRPGASKAGRAAPLTPRLHQLVYHAQRKRPSRCRLKRVGGPLYCATDQLPIIGSTL
jgi:hypothetical protein